MSEATLRALIAKFRQHGAASLEMYDGNDCAEELEAALATSATQGVAFDARALARKLWTELWGWNPEKQHIFAFKMCVAMIENAAAQASATVGQVDEEQKAFINDLAAKEQP